MSLARRIVSDLRELRWTHVAVELALVIAGILIALAVNDWAQDRRDAGTERQYLQLLARDLDQDIDELREVAAFEDRQAGDGVAAYRALRGAVQPSGEEAVAEALTRLMARRTLRLSRTTYAELLSTGNIHLIRNAVLRDRILRLYERNERMAAIVERNNQNYVDQMYLGYLLNSGLVAPRPVGNLDILSRTAQEVARRVGVPVTVADDRLWSLPADSPERQSLCNRLWVRTLISLQAANQARAAMNDVGEVREAIDDELRRRWSGPAAGAGKDQSRN